MKSAKTIKPQALFLGEVVSWSGGPGAPLSVIADALKASGLDASQARALTPRAAWGRACHKLQDDRVIDRLNKDGDFFVFQFTGKHFYEGQWVYRRQVDVRLHCVTGVVTCASEEVRQEVQAAVDAALGNRTGSDVSKIANLAFAGLGADLFPIRDGGGVYFVPNTNKAFTEKVASFLESVGGRISRFPVPAGTAEGDRSVADAVSCGLAVLIEDHLEAVGELDADSREGTFQTQAKRIQNTRTKLEAYSNYLGDRKEEIEKLLEEAQRLLKEKAGVAEQDRAAGKGTRLYMFNKPITSIIRWMGANGWKFDDALKAVHNTAGIDAASPSTVRSQLSAGKREGAKLPALTADEVRALQVFRS